MARRRGRHRITAFAVEPRRRPDRLAVRLPETDPDLYDHRRSPRRHRAVGSGLRIPVCCGARRSARSVHCDRAVARRAPAHRARKPVFGGAQYADRIARLRLRQAYGRLIRRADDRGVFVMLDRALPSRLLSAFPNGVRIDRLPLAEAAEATARFLDAAVHTP